VCVCVCVCVCVWSGERNVLDGSLSRVENLHPSTFCMLATMNDGIYFALIGMRVGKSRFSAIKYRQSVPWQRPKTHGPS